MLHAFVVASQPHSPDHQGILSVAWVEAQVTEQRVLRHTEADQLNAWRAMHGGVHVIAIGECGLDKVCKTSFPLQQEVFIAQLLWANEINKPLIIHCVKAFDEILGLLKKHSIKVPVIFHGFNKNRLLAEKIIQQGHWLSFGKALQQPAMQQIFASLPTNKIFLETDDAAINIQQIYLAATSLKNISMEQLNLQLTKNVHAVFNITV